MIVYVVVVSLYMNSSGIDVMLVSVGISIVVSRLSWVLFVMLSRLGDVSGLCVSDWNSVLVMLR